MGRGQKLSKLSKLRDAILGDPCLVSLLFSGQGRHFFIFEFKICSTINNQQKEHGFLPFFIIVQKKFPEKIITWDYPVSSSVVVVVDPKSGRMSGTVAKMFSGPFPWFPGFESKIWVSFLRFDFVVCDRRKWSTNIRRIFSFSSNGKSRRLQAKKASQYDRPVITFTVISNFWL